MVREIKYAKIYILFLTIPFLVTCRSAQKPAEPGDTLTRNAIKLTKSLDGIDPLVLKQLYLENAELRKSLDTLQQKMVEITADNALILEEGRKLKLEITNIHGDVKISLYIDDESNWIWLGKRFNDVSKPHLPVEYPSILDRNFRLGKLNPPNSKISGSTPGRRDPDLYVPHFKKVTSDYSDLGGLFTTDHTIRNELVNLNFKTFGDIMVTELSKAVDSVFHHYLVRNPFSATDASRVAEINQKLNNKGVHYIHVEILPLSADSLGRLSVTGKFWTEGNNPREKEIASFTADSQGQVPDRLRVNEVTRLSFPVVLNY